MRRNDIVLADIFLHPGQTCFAATNTRIRTILGSCVAVTMWHPLLRVGGMCHFVLPNRTGKRNGSLDGRYGEEALRILIVEAEKRRAAPMDFRTKIFGGSTMVPGTANTTALSIGAMNIACAKRVCTEFGLWVEDEHTGGTGRRSIGMELTDGRVWVRYSGPPALARRCSWQTGTK